MKKKLFTALLIVMVLALSLTAFTACNNKKAENTDVTAYAIPDDLALNISLYNGNTLIGMLTKANFEAAAQYRFTMTTTNSENTEKTTTYIGYKVLDLAAKAELTIPASITKVVSLSTDNYSGEYEITSFANAYITIGFEENGAFAADSKGPRFVSDCTSKSSNSVAKFISKITVNPVATPENTLTAIADADKYTVPSDFAITVKNGTADIATVNNTTSLEGKTQYKVAIYESATSYKEYVGYKFADLLGESVPATITSVKAAGTTCNITSVANSIIIFAKYDATGADITLNDMPRLVADYTTAVNTDDIVKSATTIIFNPPVEVAPTATAAYSIVLTWNATDLALTAVITDIGSSKSNTIILSTADGANTFANIDDKSVATDPKKSNLDLGASKKIEFTTTGSKAKTYYGYDLKTILAAMQFKKSSGSLIDIIAAANYDFVGWTCSDDVADADYNARSYTKAEIADNVISVVFDSSATAEAGQTRIFSSLDDTNPATYRNKCKNVLTIVLYKSAE